MNKTKTYPWVVAITGASGAIYGVHLLQKLKSLGLESHLVLSRVARQTIKIETGMIDDEVEKLTSHSYELHDFNAPIASGSFITSGMFIVPCSIHTLSSVANSNSGNLITRAADVCLKEGRPLLLAVRETPLHIGQLKLLVKAARAGAIVFPPVPEFYTHPKTIDDLVETTIQRMLVRMGLEVPSKNSWSSQVKNT